ncbi:hypothetical protein [Paraburkholderia sp. GAS42]|jgi:hypothetical protein|uniref:hypothetical protein n=1 Tax=Paraburkholderia sp. GAS42 TaxID=3035135 RepID=UPI003D22D856
METFTLTWNAHLSAGHETGAGAEHVGAGSSSLTLRSKLDWMERLMKVSAIHAWVTALIAIAAGLPPVSSYAYALDPKRTSTGIFSRSSYACRSGELLQINASTAAPMSSSPPADSSLRKVEIPSVVLRSALSITMPVRCQRINS